MVRASTPSFHLLKVSPPVAVPARAVSVAAPVAAAAPAPSALAPAQTGNILPEMAWSAHDATNAILSACEVYGEYVFSADPKIAVFVRQNKGVILTVLTIQADSVDAKANQ